MWKEERVGFYDADYSSIVNSTIVIKFLFNSVSYKGIADASVFYLSCAVLCLVVF